MVLRIYLSTGPVLHLFKLTKVNLHTFNQTAKVAGSHPSFIPHPSHPTLFYSTSYTNSSLPSPF